MSLSKVNLLIIANNSQMLIEQTNIANKITDLRVSSQETDDITGFINGRVSKQGEILLVNLSEQNALGELENLSLINKQERPEIIVIGDQNNIKVLKKAIHVGVKEFIDINELQVKLAASLNHIVHDLLAEEDSSRKVKRINVFINAKGGSGASFIASNVAYSLAQFSNSNTALVDLDLQFGSIGLYFDKNPEYAISEVLKMLEDENSMDSVSLEAYIEKYDDKLGLLLTSQDELVLPNEMSPTAFQRLMALIQVRYNQVVIDLPRIIDSLSSAVMEQADQVVIVLQQSLVQFRDGRRLINILNKELEIPLERISLVINRYDENHKFKKDDIVGLVNPNKVYTVRNDFDRVANALNLGVPLCESAPKSKIAKDLKKLAQELGKIQLNEKNHGIFSFFNR